MKCCSSSLQQYERGTLGQVRARDEHYIDHMDVYAEVLKQSGESAILNKLTYSLLDRWWLL
jgi:hypothetical protein